MADRIYLDHAATTPMRPEARAAMVDGLACWANPSSPHAEGRAARAALEAARGAVADAFGWRHDVIFTSGASEALDIALNRVRMPRPALVSAVEHPAVLRQRPDATVLPVGTDGLVDVAAFEPILRTNRDAIVAVQHANSETGILQPVADMIAPVHRAGGILLVDCAQTAGRLPLPAADLIVVSAHKLGGPPGVGALLVRDPGLLAAPGGQERGYRPGTENLPAILGFAAAVTTFGPPDDPAPWMAAQRPWRGLLDDAVAALGGTAIGADVPRLLTIGAYRLPGIAAATLLIRLDMAGFAVSAGSACSSGSLHASPVLTAMGLSDAAAREVIRISFGRDTRRDEIAALVGALTAIVDDIRRRAA